ncbi:MAG: ZIP family metal transporter [Patescibacteria group bacterium]
MVWLYTLTSVFIISLASFVGLLTLSLRLDQLKKLLFFLISFAAGALLGDTFLHIFPELIAESGFTISLAFYLLFSIILFFILERFIRWHHYHHVEEKDQHPVGYLNLVGDGFHNFIDGMIIGASYLVSIPLGLATTLAVLFHELPQEIGDFAILLHSGFSKRKALFFNFLSALLAVLGAVLILWLGAGIGVKITSPLLALTAGGFIYIATVDLIPELHKESNLGKSLIQLVALLFGIGLMALFLLIGE